MAQGERKAVSLIMGTIGFLLVLLLLARVAFLLCAPRSFIEGKVLKIKEMTAVGSTSTQTVIEYQYATPTGKGERATVVVPEGLELSDKQNKSVRLEVIRFGPFWRADPIDFSDRRELTVQVLMPLAWLMPMWVTYSANRRRKMIKAGT
jgi:hypothetical protein